MPDPGTALSIDRSCVLGLDTCSNALAIVPVVMRLAHSMGMAVVSECVETTAQCAPRWQMQCHVFHGHLFS